MRWSEPPSKTMEPQPPDKEVKAVASGRVNAISYMFLWWTLGIFRRGYRYEMTEADIDEKDESESTLHIGNRLDRMWRIEVEDSKMSGRSPRLLKAVWVAFSCRIVFTQILPVFIEGLQIARVIFLALLLRYFEPDGLMKTSDALCFAGGICLCSFLYPIMHHQWIICATTLGTQLRAALSSIVFRKILKLTRSSLTQTKATQVMTLLSRDTACLDRGCLFWPFLWVGPGVMAAVTFLLWLEIGYASLAGLASLAILIPIQVLTGRQFHQVKQLVASKTSHRIKLLSEIIAGIRLIKMYAWELPFSKLISVARRKELEALKTSSYMTSLVCILTNMNAVLIPFLCILTSTLLGGHVSASKLFVTYAYVDVLRLPLIFAFPRSIVAVVQTANSFRRIQKFLLSEEHKRRLSSIIPHARRFKDNAKVIVMDATSKWDATPMDVMLASINLQVKDGELLAIVGAPGAGKSSLLHAIMGELPLCRGGVYVKGRMSYSSQRPWVFMGSVKDNVTCGQPFDDQKYQRVLQACALVKDLALLPSGDATLIGDNGFSLSKCQKSRINLARTLYRKAEVYLLDEPLSAVDSTLGHHIFQDAIKGFLKGKTCLLVTRQQQYLREVHNIFILRDGEVEDHGTFRELRSRGVDLNKYVCTGEEGWRLGAGRVTSSSEEEEDTSNDIRPVESNRKFSVAPGSVEVTEPVETVVDRPQRSADSPEYLQYLARESGWCTLTCLVAAALICDVLIGATQIWLMIWGNLETRDRIADSENDMANQSGSNFSDTLRLYELGLLHPSKNIRSYIYAGFVAGVVIFFFVRTIGFFVLSMKISAKLHSSMFHSVLRTGIYFFETNSTGRILNRFVKDVSIVDELLPKTLFDAGQYAGQMVVGILVTVVASYWLSIPTIALLSLAWSWRRFCAKTTKGMRRLEISTRCKIVSHVSSTLQGLTTIRTLGCQETLSKCFEDYQTKNVLASRLCTATNEAFLLGMDFLCALHVTVTVGSFLAMDRDAAVGNAGLGISSALLVSILCQWTFRMFSEAESLLTSVGKIQDYIELDPEPALESSSDSNVPSSWPEVGSIVFERVTLPHPKTVAFALKEISFTIKAGEKIGIVDRGGGEASAVVTSMLRMAEPEGIIKVDGVDIRSVGLHKLRGSIAVIPKDSTLFSGTVRFNLDPFNRHVDHDLWKALEEVNLARDVRDLPKGLNSNLSEEYQVISNSTKRLMCFAKVLLNDFKILVVEEMASRIDEGTEETIKRIIRKKFPDRTIVTVATRLQTIMESDKVIVLEDGRMVEHSRPYILLQDETSYLTAMVGKCGPATAERLFGTAQESYSRTLALRRDSSEASE